MANQIVPSSSFSSTPSWTYDVFLSFRGDDTCYNFTDHLYRALDRHGINTFIDHRELRSGEEISPSLLKAIRESRISVIIFSEKYASSSWCLDELVHILECRKSRGQMTRPIFYKVEPSDVRHQKNSYDAAFADHSRKYENDPEKVQRWRKALTEAANLKGATLNEGEYEATFINNFIAEISTEVLNRTYLHVASYPVGIESCAKEVEVLLGVGGNDRRVVGIWGTSGIGKTTIARAVYNASAHKFEGSCFLADVSETLASREGAIELQKTLLSDILRGTESKIVDAYQGINLIKNRLSQKKILLILDDVDKLERLKDWVDVNCFSEGSRVIITTKDRRLLKFYGGQWIYEVQKLGYDEALELFSWNAFKRNRPPDDYLSLAQRAIVQAQCLPLALNLIGSYLRNESIGRWQAVLNSYDSYDGEPYTDIQIILRKTFDVWDYNLQQVFLDIACFFKGENKDYVLQMLRSSTLNVRQDIIDVLVEKAIIAIEHNQILMHNLLEKMGKHIVYEESPTEPGKRSRLWHHEDVCDVLIDCRGTKKIRGIVVNLPEPDEIPVNPESFLKMVNLEFFINRNAHFSGRVDYLPNSLRLIEFGGRFNIDQKHTYELNLQSNFHPRHLVKFDVSYSGIRQLKEFKNLAKLTWMNLSGCEFLEKIPNLSGSPNIKRLNLSGCENLVEVDDSVGFLDKLVELDLRWCSNLTRFATRLGLRSLCELSLTGCRRLGSFPEIEGKMEFLYHLDIAKSGIRELPSIACFTGLHTMKASGCELQNIQLLPFGKKVKFDEVSSCSTNLQPSLKLELEGCNLSESDFLVPLDCWSALTALNLSRNNFVSLPDCISKAVNVWELNLSGCKRLREIPALPPKLLWLHLAGCTSLEKIPKLPPTLGRLDLCHCSGLSGDEVAKLENNLLNEGIHPRSQLCIVYPANEVPKWFSYTSNHPTTIQPLPQNQPHEIARKVGFVGCSEFRFEIPLKLQVGETLLGWAISFVLEPSTRCSLYEPWEHYSNVQCILINGKKTLEHRYYGIFNDLKATHVRLELVGLGEQEQQGDICQIVFRVRNQRFIKSCGVHLFLRQQLLQRQDPMQFQGRNPQLQAMLQQQRLRQQQQILQSMPQLQRAQLQQQQQQQQQKQQQQLRQQQFQQPMQPVSSIKRPYDGGVCARRLMQYLYHQRQRPADNSIAYWRKFVTGYYSPRAKKRWCLSLYDNVGHHALGAFSQAAMDAWQWDICGSKSGRGFEATFEVPPRLNEIKFGSGVIDELLFLDLPRECRFPCGVMMLEYGKAVQESVYEQLRVVREGQLRIIFTQDLKILSWEFCARRHEELLPRRLVAPQEASSSFNNSNHSPSSTFQGAAALIPGSMQNLPGSALSSPHLPSRQPQQLQQRSLSSNSLLQQTHSTGSQGNQALQQQMIQQLLQEMSNNRRRKRVREVLISAINPSMSRQLAILLRMQRHC